MPKGGVPPGSKKLNKPDWKAIKRLAVAGREAPIKWAAPPGEFSSPLRLVQVDGIQRRTLTRSLANQWAIPVAQRSPRTSGSTRHDRLQRVDKRPSAGITMRLLPLNRG